MWHAKGMNYVHNFCIYLIYSELLLPSTTCSLPAAINTHTILNLLKLECVEVALGHAHGVE